jgi:hypothetical protein
MIEVVPSDGKMKTEKELEKAKAFAPESGCC